MLEIVERTFTVTGSPVPVTFVAKRLGLHHETARQHIGALFEKGAVMGPGSPITPTEPTAEPRRRYGYMVYFLYDRRTNLVKIGKSIFTGVEQRIQIIKSGMRGNARDFVMLVGILDAAAERDFHRKFADARAHGEWFTLTGELREEISCRFGVDLQPLRK